MKIASHNHWAQLLNIGLRLTSLATKLVLTLYITRYLDLSAMGYFGIVSGSVLILTVVLGMNFNYVVSRELVGASPSAALVKMRDQGVFYLINQAILALTMIVIVVLNLTDIKPQTMLVVFVLSVLDNWGDTTFLNLISMGKPVVANLLLFIRTALWVFPVVAIGLVWPEFRTARTIFIAWSLGSAGSSLLALYLWRHLPWREVLKTSVDWVWIKKSIRLCFLIWLGSIGGTMGYFVDRFVLAHNATLDLVGVATFYTSFGGALFALIHSGVLSFSYPRLIALYRKDDKAPYNHEARKLAWHVAVLAAVLGLGMGVGVPVFGRAIGRPELAEHATTLWLILFATWLKCNAETLYYILFSKHQDGALWMGGLLYLIPSLGCNLILVPLFGITGIGYSAVISAFLILLWRGWHVYKNNDPASIIEMPPPA